MERQPGTHIAPDISNTATPPPGIPTALCVHPDLILGTYDLAGRPNMMAAAWGGISVRPSRYTHQSLLDKREFTISIPSEQHIAEADCVGIESGKTIDKFAVTGLTPKRSELSDAPYVDEFPVILECRLTKTLDLGVHTLFVGEILDVKVDEAGLSPKAGHSCYESDMNQSISSTHTTTDIVIVSGGPAGQGRRRVL